MSRRGELPAYILGERHVLNKPVNLVNNDVK